MFKVLLAALILRLISLTQSLWLDEAISFTAVKNYHFWEIITKFAPGDVHPPLYYLLLKLWTDIFGYSEISLRFPSVIAGVIAVFLVIRIGEKLFNRKIGLLAGLFLAVNPLAIYYSQEARMYSLVLLTVLLTIFTFLRKKWFWFYLFLLTTLFLDYIPWLILPLFLPYSLLAFIPVLPWLPVMWQQFQASNLLAQNFPLWGQVVGAFDLKAVALVPVKFIFGRIPTHFLFAFPAAVYFAILSKARNRFLWTWLLFPLALGLILSVRIPIFTYHRFLFVLPAFLLLLAAGAVQKRLLIWLVIVVSLVSLAAFDLTPSFQREDWREAVAYFNSDPGVVLLPNLSQAAPILYYNPAQAVFDKNNLPENLDSPVYLIRYVQEIFDPQDTQKLRLENTGHHRVAEKNFNGVVVWKYVF